MPLIRSLYALAMQGLLNPHLLQEAIECDPLTPWVGDLALTQRLEARLQQLSCAAQGLGSALHLRPLQLAAVRDCRLLSRREQFAAIREPAVLRGGHEGPLQGLLLP